MSLEIEEIKRCLRELRLSYSASILESELSWATKDRPGYSEFLARLATKEMDQRRERSRERRLKAAGFREVRRIEDFDFDKPEKIDARLVRELATLRFVEEKQSVWIAGPPGTGKTHIAVSLGVRAIEKGYRVRYRSMGELSRTLHASIADRSEERCLVALNRPEVLIVEDLGFANIPADAMSLLFELFDRRHGKASTIATSNLGGEAAERSYRDVAIAGAIYDRLLEHAHIVTITGPSVRPEHRPSKRKNGVAGGRANE